jgi:hypothetical protein
MFRVSIVWKAPCLYLFILFDTIKNTIKGVVSVTYRMCPYILHLHSVERYCFIVALVSEDKVDMYIFISQMFHKKRGRSIGIAMMVYVQLHLFLMSWLKKILDSYFLWIVDRKIQFLPEKRDIGKWFYVDTPRWLLLLSTRVLYMTLFILVERIRLKILKYMQVISNRI